MAILDEAEPLAKTAKDLEAEEMLEFGPWQYPWSPEVWGECAARLLLRSKHETLAGGPTALFVLLSFLRLYHRQETLGTVQGAEMLRIPFLSFSSDLGSWPDAQDQLT